MTKIGTPPILEKIIANLRRGWGVFFPAGAPVAGAEAVAERLRSSRPSWADWFNWPTKSRIIRK